MLKRVEEDWSFFNQAVRERAEGKSRQEVPPLKLVIPEPLPTPNKPKPPPVQPLQPPAATPAASTSPSRPRPLNAGREIVSILKLLFGIIAIVMLVALIEAASRNAHPTDPAATDSKPSGAGTGTVGTGGTEKVVTDYTTFNTIAYRSWKVVTGWKFANSHAAQPDHQYCYLEVLAVGGQQIYAIEERFPTGRHDMPEALIPGLDKAAWDEAATKCVWHPSPR